MGFREPGTIDFQSLYNRLSFGDSTGVDGFRPALRHPEHAELIQRVLAIPAKRHEQKLVCFLTREEIDALLSAPDNGTWFGRRDHALLTLAVQTCLRVSELTRLVGRDIHLGTGAYVRCDARAGRNARRPLPPTPSPRSPAGSREHDCGPTDPVLPTRRGQPLSTDAVAWLLTQHAATAARHCPSLNDKHLTPHVCGIPRPCNCSTAASTSP